MSDTWKNNGVVYTIDAKIGTGGIVTAQREPEMKIYSRVVTKVVSRDETEKLFESDFTK